MLTPFLCLILLISTLLYFYKWLAKQRRDSPNWSELQKIPGPVGYPIIGTAFIALHSSEEIFQRCRENALKYFPIYKEWSLHKNIVNIIHPEDIKIVLSSMKNSTKFYAFFQRWLKSGLLTSTGNKWQYRRKLLTPAFHLNILQDFVGIFNKETDLFVQNLQETGKINLTHYSSKFTLRCIKETAMGSIQVSDESMSEYNEAINTIGKLYLHRIERPWINKQEIYDFTPTGRKEKRTIEKLHKFTSSIIEEKQKQFSTSANKAMLDLLLTAKEAGKIDEEGIREEVDTFMFGGHDTTATALAYTLMLLANHRDIQNRIIQEMEEVLTDQPPTLAQLQNLKYLERCIKETLRLYPSIPFIMRVIGEEISLFTGYKLPKNTVISIQIFDLHHNPNIYPEPEMFDPDRFLPENTQNRHPFAYIPFSAGPRNCIGQKFAMLEIKAFVVGVLRRFILEPIDSPESICFIMDVVLRPKNDIQVKFVPRSCKMS